MNCFLFCHSNAVTLLSNRLLAHTVDSQRHPASLPACRLNWIGKGRPLPTKWCRNAPRDLLQAPNKLMERAAPPSFLSSPHLFFLSGASALPPAKNLPPNPFPFLPPPHPPLFSSVPPLLYAPPPPPLPAAAAAC